MQNISNITQSWAKTLAPLCQAPGQKQALQALLELGLPDQHLEAWVYTKTSGALEGLTPVFTESMPSPQSTLQGRYGITLRDGRVVEYILSKDFSYQKLEGEQLEQRPTDGFEALHAIQPKAYTHLIKSSAQEISQEKSEEERTLYVYLQESEDAKGTVTPARLKFAVGPHCKINLIFILSNLSRPGLSLSHVDICLEENAQAKVAIITTPSTQRLTFHRWRTFLKRDSHLEAVLLSVGAWPARHEFEAHLTEAGASVAVQGLYLLANRQHADIHTMIHHEAPHTTSTQLFKAVVQDEAFGIYTGKVVIHPGCKGSNAGQKALGLLLSKKAHFSTRPQLEVYNDDVKCGHGAAVGQLNEDESFYLASRGVSPERSRQILLEGFVGEIVRNFPLPSARIELEKAVKEYFQALPGDVSGDIL